MSNAPKGSDNMKKLSLLIISLFMLFSLCGCHTAPLDSENMLRPPKTSGYEQDICEALEAHLGRQPLFRYPRSGEYRSAITMKDLDGDGIEEAIVFYASSPESPLASIAVMNRSHGGWHVTATAEGLAGNVNTLLFGNILPRHTGSEIVVGWSVSSGSGLLTVYSYSEDSLQTVVIENQSNAEAQSSSGYSGVAVCDMDGDGIDEIMTATLNTVAGTSVVRMLKYMSGEGAEQLYTAGVLSLDGSVTRYSKVTVNMLDDTTQAFIIDSYKASDTMCTEAVCWDKFNAVLTTPFNNRENGAVSGTDRAAVIASFDADGDGLTEIPTHTLLPCYTDSSEQKLYKTSWFSYDSISGSLSEQSELETILNTSEGYYMVLPPSWPSDITARYDPTYRTMTFCVPDVSWEEAAVTLSELTGSETVLSSDPDSDSAVIWRRVESFGTELFKIRAFDPKNESLIPSYGYEKLISYNDTVWGVQICPLGEQYEITYNVIYACFYLL